MALARRVVHVLALAGTALVIVVALGLIATQTSWFRDWLRRYVVAQSRKVLAGELSIGRLGGNLFSGVNLDHVTVSLDGERVIAVRRLELDYRLAQLISSGLVFDRLHLEAPRVLLRRTSDGWTLGRLVRREAEEAERRGPGRPIAIDAISIADGDIRIEGAQDGAVRVPHRVAGLDARLSFHYRPVRYTVDVERLSLRTVSPDLTVRSVRGTIAVRGADLHLETVELQTARSTLAVSGAIRRYTDRPELALLARSDRFSLPELAPLVPALDGRLLEPRFEVRLDGPLDRLGVTAHAAAGEMALAAGATLDLTAPSRAVRGEVHLTALDLAPLLADPRLASRLTGRAGFTLVLPPGGMEALRGTWSFRGPEVRVAGYDAQDVEADGRIERGRIVFGGRAAAYGARATAAGVLRLPRGDRRLALEVSGRLAGADLRRLPPTLRVPPLASDLAGTYRLRLDGNSVVGESTLERSIVEGAVFEAGTVARVESRPGRLRYSAAGAVRDLDLARIGRVLEIDALAGDRFRSRLNGRFRVDGTGTQLATLQLDAAGRLEDSRLFGSHLAAVDFTARLERRALEATARGTFAELDPAALAGRRQLDGRLTGTFDVEFAVPDVARAGEVEALVARAKIEFGAGTIGGLGIDTGIVDGRADRGTVTLNRLEVRGPALALAASGQIGLAPGTVSDARYRLDATRLESIGGLAGLPLGGAALIEGTVTGPREALVTSGTIDGSRVTYGGRGALDLNSRFRVTLPDLRPEALRVEADTRATFLKAGPVELQEVAARTVYTKGEVAFDGSIHDRGRVLEARGTLLLHPDHNEIHLPAFALRAGQQEWRIAGADPAVQFGGGRVSVRDVRLVSGDQSLEVSGTLATSPEAPPGELQVRAAAVDLAALERLLLLDRGLAGRLTAEARIAGPADTRRVDGRLEIVQGAFRTFRFESFAAGFGYTGERIAIDARLDQSPGQWLTVQGTAPLTLFRPTPGARAVHVPGSAADTVDLRVHTSTIDLGLVQGFTTRVQEVTGTLQADVTISGSGRDPHFSGHITIRGGAFTVPATGVAYDGLETTIELLPDRVVIPRFALRDEHGNPLHVAGELAVHERALGAVDVALRSDDFEVLDNELGDVGLGVDLRVSGELRRPRVQGTIEVASARIEVDRLLARTARPYPTTAATPP
ncbi:MAG TPA: hypothetical protein VNI83_02700, partial [Vicinamibacterales bacterium]|nr:hypothetical protein [Vicinamibacterales bacterium]